jgi:hypothetical protein
VNKFSTTAATLGERGITALRNVLDYEGKPKQRSTDDFLHLRPRDNTTHDWESAAGIAFVLGPASGGLACVDVDDKGLGEWLEHQLGTWARPPLMARTPNGLHVHVIEPVTTPPAVLAVTYQSRICRVELLGAGRVATIPPTDGYEWVDPRAEPVYATLRDFWRRCSLEFCLFSREVGENSPFFARRSGAKAGAR